MARTNRKSEEAPAMLNPVRSSLDQESEEQSAPSKPSGDPSPEYWEGSTDIAQSKKPRRLNQYTKF